MSDSEKKQIGEKQAMLRKMPSWLSVPVVVMGLLLLVAGAAAVYFWQESNDAQSQTAEGIAERNEEESTRIIAELDEVLLTESDAEPTVARIEDPALLQSSNQEFYKNAQSGDYLVLYPQRAVVYRSEETRVINVAPIIDTSQLERNGTQSTDQSNDQDQNNQ